MAGKTKPRKRIVRKVSNTCLFCDSKKDPYYFDTELLSKFISDRSRIYGTDRSGVCAKHQRKLSLAIKQARHLALLPFKGQI